MECSLKPSFPFGSLDVEGSEVLGQDFSKFCVCWCHPYLEIFLKHWPGTVGPGQSLRSCISNKLPGDSGAVCAQTLFQKQARL